MKLSRLIVLALAVAMAVGATALPASANKVPNKGPAGPSKDIGTIDGTAAVGKDIDVCPNNGAGTVSGGGLGFPVISPTKNAWFTLKTNFPTVPTDGVRSIYNSDVGNVSICGRLNPTLSKVPLPGQVKPGIGASCGLSKAYGGKGVITYTTGGKPDVWLTDVGWKNSAATMLPVVGRAHVGGDPGTGKNKPGTRDYLIAVVNAQGGAACASKSQTDTSNNKGGATSFVVRGLYWIYNGITEVDQQATPVICKSTARIECAYADKK